METKYVTPYKYAQLCGVSYQAIYQRIKKETLQRISIPSADGELKDYIDIEKYPPKNLDKKIIKNNL